jgi:hypothetical protein
MRNFKQINLGKCLNEYQHPLYAELLNQCDAYVVTNEMNPEVKGQKYSSPKCGPNQFCYGILSDSGVKILLRYIVDSSD